MDQSIWDEEKEYLVFDDNSETTIWEDLERIPSSNDTKLPLEEENIGRLGEEIGNWRSFGLHTTIWEDLQKNEPTESKNVIKKKETKKLSADWKNQESFNFRDEKKFSPLLIQPSHINSNFPQIFLRNSRSNSNSSNVNVYNNPMRRVSRCNSGAKSPFSISSRRVSRCNSGALACRIAKGPDGTIGFHKGRSGKWLREHGDTSVSHTFTTNPCLEIGVNNGNNFWQKVDAHSNSSFKSSRSSKMLDTEKNKIGENVTYFGSGSHQHLLNLSPTRVSQRARKKNTTTQNDINKKSSTRQNAFNFAARYSPIFSNDDTLKDSIENQENQVTKSLTMSSRRLPIKIQETRRSSWSIPQFNLLKETNTQNEHTSSELADEEARLDARIAHLSQSALDLGNDFCHSSRNSRFLDVGRPCEESRYLESFSR